MVLLTTVAVVEVLSQSGTFRLMEYLGIEPAKRDEAKISALQNLVESPTATMPSRLLAFHQLLQACATQLGMDTTGLSKAMDSWAQRQTLKYNLKVFEDLDYPFTPDGELAEVKKFGNGKIPVVLIPEYRKNWSMYEEFIQQNLEGYTFYAITLPGYNGTRPYRLPAGYDFSNRIWLDNVVNGVIQLIERDHLDRPIIVGSLNAGSYIGIQVASRLSQKVRGLILLNGVLRTGSDPNAQKLSEADRAELANRSYDNVIWYLLRRYSFSDAELDLMVKRRLPPAHPIFHYTRDTLKVKSIYRMHNTFRSVMERYDLEWQTADLTDQLRTIQVPILAAFSIYDDGWPFDPKVNPRVNQWREFLKETTKKNIQITEVSNSRLLISVDCVDISGMLLDSFSRGIQIPERIGK